MFRLNREQMRQLAEFSANLSLVFFGSVIAPFFALIDTVDVSVVVCGVILGFLYLGLSLTFLKNKKI